MARSFYSHRVEIIPREFITQEGNVYSKTARVTLLDEQNHEITVLSLGVPDLNTVYDAIGNGAPVNLNECYVKGFSLTACRRLQLLDKTATLPIAGFIAKESFFVSPISLDFTNADFTGDYTHFEGATFVSPELNFHGSRFSNGGVNMSNMYVKVGKFNMVGCDAQQGNVTFKNTIFDSGAKDFQDFNFGSGVVEFTNTEFGNGDVSFINTRYNSSDVSFKVARFGIGKVDFHFAKFGSGTVSFERTEFGTGRVDFRTVEFGQGKTSFNRCSFGDGEVTFDGANANNGKITFNRSQFGLGSLSFEQFHGAAAQLIFEKVTFPGDVNFSSAVLESLLLPNCQFNGKLNLQVDICQNIDLSGSVVRDIADFYSFGNVPRVNVLNLAGMRLLGKFYLDWKVNKLQSLIYNQPRTTMDEKAEQFRILKENFSDLGRYSDEDYAYVEFRRCELKTILQYELEGNWVSKALAYPHYFFKKLVFDWIGLYATEPARVFVSIIAIYVFFSLLYIGLISSGIGNILPTSVNGESLGLVGRSFYHSAITFFTIGYGDFVPVGAIRLFCGFEGFIGVFLMAYFTVAFVRKILR